MIFSDLICIFAQRSHFYHHKNVKRGTLFTNFNLYHRNMSDEKNEIIPENEAPEKDKVSEKSSTYLPCELTEDNKTHLSGMYQSWFLDFASYVILQRAVPHIDDGLKPVQRRILHVMKRMEDGRNNKVASIVGETMKFHPHGDSSIYGALVTLGQKEMLIDCQGNWGNILTGANAAAGRYIEARLTKFALEALYNPKITNWKTSYDGRNDEPITLPVKFPLLLAQGTEGIGYTLSVDILPHNFNELIDASIAYLRGEDFQLYPDFQTGGLIDVSRYNDGRRGGSVKVRAKIEKRDQRTLVITEIPYRETTLSVIESIEAANEKGKIKIRKIEDITTDHAEIVIHLQTGTSSDKTIDALYAFTKCEVRIWPICCVICDNKPLFLSVSEVLRHNTDRTLSLLRQELQIQRNELLETLHFLSLEKIFIEKRIYKDKEYENSVTPDDAINHIDSRLAPFKKLFIREITREDIEQLMEIKMKRIIKFNADKTDRQIAAIKADIEEIDNNLAHIVDFTIRWYSHLRDKYGDKFPRHTVIRNFDAIEASKVAEANEKLYINREEGFIGTSLKRDEYVCNCSDIDDIIIFYKDGKYKVVKVCEKMFVGKNILYINIFKRNDNRTIYNVIYRNGKGGLHYIKRFAVTGITRNKEYDLTQGEPGSRVVYFTANPNGEAEIIKVTFKPKLRQKAAFMEKNFGDIAIKGRQSMGNILTRNDIERIRLKEQGGSTLGGRKVWFDHDVLRLNYDGRGDYLGEFHNGDQVLVILKDGNFYTTSFDAGNHYDTNILIIEKFDANRCWTAALYDADQKYPYLKRFTFESSQKKQNFLGDNPASQLLLLSKEVYPRIEVKFGENDAYREPLIIEAADFIGIKSFHARGKRLTTFAIESITELEPTRHEEPTPEPDIIEPEGPTIDENGQKSLF